MFDDSILSPEILVRDFNHEVLGNRIDASEAKIMGKDIEENGMNIPETYALLLNSPEFEKKY